MKPVHPFISNQSLTVEARLLAVIKACRKPHEVLAIKEITHCFAHQYGDSYQCRITPKWVGGLIRKKLHLRTERRTEGYVIAREEGEKLNLLLERYEGNEEEQAASDTPEAPPKEIWHEQADTPYGSPREPCEPGEPFQGGQAPVS